MKSIKSFLFFGIILLLSLFIAFCSKNFNDSLVQTYFNNSEFRSELSVTIAKTSQDDIMILTEGKNAEPNALYFFQSLEIPKNIYFEIKNATIIKNKEILLIHSDNKNILLSMKDATIPEKVQKLENLVTYQGFGLINYKKPTSYQKVLALLKTEKETVNSRSAGNDIVISIDFATCKCVKDDPKASGALCKSGGPGSSSCSLDDTKELPHGIKIGSICSVNCNSGYFSCCMQDY